MKKLLICVMLTLCCALGAQVEAIAEEPTPSPTRVPDMIAVPEGTTREPATPRPTDAPLPEDPFMAHAIEISRRIELLARSRDFLFYYEYSDLTWEQIDNLTRGDHTNPTRIFEMTGDAMLTALSAAAPEGSVMPDLSRAELRRDLVSDLPDMLMTELTYDEQSLLHTLWRVKVFACADIEGCGLMTLLYEDAVPILVMWYADRGAVSMSACFMPDDALAGCTTAEQVAEWFASRGLPEAAFREVDWQ